MYVDPLFHTLFFIYYYYVTDLNKYYSNLLQNKDFLLKITSMSNPEGQYRLIFSQIISSSFRLYIILIIIKVKPVRKGQ
ncbi:hypothetical protein D7D81_17615 [Halocella sp. SP3-1]|nr:hypothetical protein D7D81_17615 [Halocella sp. SP3-1]